MPGWWFIKFNIKLVFPDPEPWMISILWAWLGVLGQFGLLFYFFCHHIKINHSSVLYLFFAFLWLISSFYCVIYLFVLNVFIQSNFCQSCHHYCLKQVLTFTFYMPCPLPLSLCCDFNIILFFLKDLLWC